MTATQPKLPKVFKRKWVEALRSGEFKQGKYLLYRRKDDAYCCLGVAARVCGTSEARLRGSLGLEHDMAPKHVLDVLGEFTGAPGSDGTLQDRLSIKNDGGWSFKRIASYIERYL